MCRMIMAVGQFDPSLIVAAAEEMARGTSARHERPVPCHPNGWGALTIADDEKRTLETIVGISPFWEAPERSQIVGARNSRLLAIHARHATVSTTTGRQYCHPLLSDQGDSIHMMHNGFLPTVHRELGLDRSAFDSDEYLRWVREQEHLSWDGEQRGRALDALSPGGSSGNAFFVQASEAQAFVWYPHASKLKSYFTMHFLLQDDFSVIASEPCEVIAEASAWQALERCRLLAFDLESRSHLPIDRSRM